MKAAPLLALSGLTAGYGNTAVIRDVNVTIGAGEVVALFGPNGAGKTTTLRTISGLIKPIEGEVRYEGADLRDVSPVQRARSGIAHLPEGIGVYHSLTVAEHFRLGSRKHPLDEDAALHYFPALKELRSRRAGLMSGGEQRMLGIGRALARRPRLLLFDELSLGLAPAIAERILPVVRAYARDSGSGVLLVEQHVRLGLEVADRACVLSHGDIVVQGAAEELRSNTDLITSSYLGEHSDPAKPPGGGR